MFRECNAGIVTGLNDHAEQQVLYRYPGSDFDEHSRTLGSPGLLAHGDLVLEAHQVFCKCAENRIGGHQLGQAGWREPLVRLKRGQFDARVAVHKQKALGADDWRRRYWHVDRRIGDGRRRQQDQG